MSRSYTFDALQQLCDGQTFTSSAAAQVASSAKIIDVGQDAPNFSGVAVIDVSAIKITANNELYTMIVQGSSSPTFASDIENLASLSLGATEVRPGGAIDSSPGRYEVPFFNKQDGVQYRYLRLFVVTAGTSPSATLRAFIGTARNMMP
jgi:hypothetical protein